MNGTHHSGRLVLLLLEAKGELRSPLVFSNGEFFRFRYGVLHSLVTSLSILVDGRSVGLAFPSSKLILLYRRM
jgi:hypothetical protein